MALVWKTRVVRADESEDVGTGTWEPFATVVEDGEALILVKGLVEEEGEKSSTKPGNENLAGNEPDRGD